VENEGIIIHSKHKLARVTFRVLSFGYNHDTICWYTRQYTSEL